MMKQRPLVSIITPSYNQADFLEAAIQSVLGQDYPDIEYGIVDGGSDDGSVDVIKKYESQVNWWVSEPDEGQGYAINKGIARSSGEVVAWLNSDDLLLPQAISEAVDSLELYGADLVFGNAIIIDENGFPLNDLVFEDWGLEDLLRFRVICQPAVIMKRKVWEEVSGINTDLHYMLDHQLWIKIASKFSIKHVPSFWACSRYHTKAKNVALAAAFSKDTGKVLEWIKTDPILSPYYQMDKNHIRGGAYRLSGRYLLDGEYPAKALLDYCRAVWFWPSYALKHWRRILFSLISSITLIKISKFKKTPQKTINRDWGNLEDWPGIDLTEAGP
jgi:glycosyltransferase involved in cell wall biosynthesis